MSERLRNILWTVLTVLLLCGFTLAVPLGSLTPEAQKAYLDETPVDEDDEYAFLYE